MKNLGIETEKKYINFSKKYFNKLQQNKNQQNRKNSTEDKKEQ